MYRLVLLDKHKVGEWVAEQVGQTASWGDFQAFGIETSRGEMVAGTVLHLFNQTNCYSHIAIKKPSKLLPSMLFTATAYAFIQCKLKRMTGMVPVSEQGIIAFDEKIGFEKETTLKDAANDGDMQVMVMWANKCPWIPQGALDGQQKH